MVDDKEAVNIGSANVDSLAAFVTVEIALVQFGCVIVQPVNGILKDIYSKGLKNLKNICPVSLKNVN